MTPSTIFKINASLEIVVQKILQNSNKCCVAFLIFLQMEPLKKPQNFQAGKIRKVFIFQEMELFDPKIKEFFIFSRKEAFLIFLEMETQKNLLYFRKWNFFIFQGAELSYISGRNFPSSKVKRIYSQKVPYILGNGSF